MNESPGARLLGPGDVRVLVEELGFRPSKQRGQNFVTDANTIRRIVRAAEIDDSDLVLEIGPGLGSLTLGLLADTAAGVVAVEVEPSLAELLPGTVGRYAPAAVDRLQVVTADALRLASPPGDTAPTVLVANLPYNVAVPVLLRVLETMPTVRRGLVMVQLEVADRLVATPGSKVYGIPSVKARWYADVARAGVVGRAVFWPRPNVDSGLVSFTRHAPPTTDVSRERVFALVDAAFAQRRKTLRAALSAFAGSAAAAEAALVKVGVEPSTRGERLTITDFVRIAEALEEGT